MTMHEQHSNDLLEKEYINQTRNSNPAEGLTLLLPHLLCGKYNIVTLGPQLCNLRSESSN